jgi:hypothetical protein
MLATGCATSGSGTSRTRTTVPSGPVSTGSNDPGLIPSGTELVIRTNERVETKAATAQGKVYSAQTARDIVDTSGNVLVPSGSPVELMVVDSSGGGTAGTPSLDLGVSGITVRGTRYAVDTETERESGRGGVGANRRTATMVGGGALLGTLIGAAAGGGAGAAIGAAIGAAGGGAVQVLTRGNEVRVPAETVMTFRLDAPVRLRGYRQ